MLRRFVLLGLYGLLLSVALSAGEAPTLPAPVDHSPPGRAPAKLLDDGGIQFGPEIAKSLLEAIANPSAVQKSMGFVGPGLPAKDVTLKAPPSWNWVINAKELSGADGTPRALLAVLPDYLAREKPEVVFFFGETTPVRKLSPTEKYDWTDLARMCLRLGAIPVLAVPSSVGKEKENAPENKEESLRAIMLQAAADSGCAVIDLKAPSQVARRVAELAFLLEKHVFCRAALDAKPPSSGGATGPGTVEE